MILRGLLALLGCAALLLSAHPALAGGGCLVPTAGYLVHLGGNAGRLEDAPSFGGRLEYNFSSRHVRAVGLVYSFSRHGLEGQPAGVHLDQHLCMLGYRFGRDWRWLNFGSQVSTGAVVRDAHGADDSGFKAGFAIQTGVNMSVCPARWLQLGPDVSFLLATDADKWIFGGKTSYFFYFGGHLAVTF